MLGKIADAQVALESDIELLRHAAAMSGDGAALAAAQGQMSRLAGLQHRIEHTHGGGLTAIRAEVMASVAASQTVAQQAKAIVASAHMAEVALHAAQAEAHRVTADFVRDFYERKIFDKYLDFASPEERRAYREREEARHTAIEEAHAEGTPEGNLRAAHLMVAQVEDGEAHGMGNAPGFAEYKDRVMRNRDNLSNAMVATGRSEDDAGRALTATERKPAADAGFSEIGAISPDVLASLQAAGVVLADQMQQGHGVTIAPPGSQLGRA